MLAIETSSCCSVQKTRQMGDIVETDIRGQLTVETEVERGSLSGKGRGTESH